ncbi:MAG: ribbon-helix-helix domain-containing protein [Desulfonauticus sp.]|nr:ribbon-helix-helix domain-containing protein [Desulfonauticus sp.]
MKKRQNVMLEEDLFRALKSRSERTGQSISHIVRQAVENYLWLSEKEAELTRAGKLIDQLREEFQEQREELEQIKERMEQLEEWQRRNLFWTALLTELVKTKLFTQYFNKIDDQLYKQFKNTWRKLHEVADWRVEKLTKQKVWDGTFDPIESPPIK